MEKKTKLYVVITTDCPADDTQYMCDIILITTDEKKAEKTVEALQKRKPIKGIDYDLLTPFNDADYFERTLDVLISNEEE